MFSSLCRQRTQRPLALDNVQAVLFDLDGTLVDVDMHRFVPAYLSRLTGRMQAFAEPGRATRAMHRAVAAMFANCDPHRTLEAVWCNVLEDELGIAPDDYNRCLEAFYRTDLDDLRPLVSGHPVAVPLVDAALARGWRAVLATNPIFPRSVVDARVAWGGLDITRFDHVTAYETAHFCKPNPAFFTEILANLRVDAAHCLMVGNDTLHDLAASRAGITTCLLNPWVIERRGAQDPADWRGTHEELLMQFSP